MTREQLEKIALKAAIYQEAQARRAFHPGNERIASEASHADRELSDALGPWRQERAAQGLDTH